MPLTYSHHTPGRKAQCNCQRLQTLDSEKPLGRVSLAKDLQPAKTSAWISRRQSDCFQATRVGNVHLNEQFTALESPMAHVVCISTELHLYAAGEEAPLRDSSLWGGHCSTIHHSSHIGEGEVSFLKGR